MLELNRNRYMNRAFQRNGEYPIAQQFCKRVIDGIVAAWMETYSQK